MSGDGTLREALSRETHAIWTALVILQDRLDKLTEEFDAKQSGEAQGCRDEAREGCSSEQVATGADSTGTAYARHCDCADEAGSGRREVSCNNGGTGRCADGRCC